MLQKYKQEKKYKRISSVYLGKQSEFMAINNDIGKGGEAAARAFLERKGYQIIHTNWHYHHYELDIVAFHEGELVIVEVKTRSQNYLLEPEEAVDLKKIRRTVTAADAYVRFFNYHLPVRFDIITLLKDKEGYHIREHIEDAFYPPAH